MPSPQLLGWYDGEELLGWDDDEPLLAWLGSTIIGLIDPVGGALGGPVGERVYTVSATLYPDWAEQGAPTADTIAPATANHPIAGLPFGAEVSGVPPLEVRMASMDFATRYDDPGQPSVFWDGRVIDPGSISLSMPLVPVGDAAIQTSVGRVVISNADGALDVVLDDNSAVSQALEIRAGRLNVWMQDFVTVFRARITSVGMTESEATLELQDPVLYANNLFPTAVYTGAGGAAGDAELDGTVKPVVLGRVWNMSPVLINAVSLIFQVHDGPVAEITGVFDGGVALAFDADYATYAALAAATIASGEYGTCLAAGLLRVGGTPAYALTAHVDGHLAANITTASIATWLVQELEAAVGLAVDVPSFLAMPDWLAGWVWTSEFTFAEAISRFVGDAGYHWGADVTGVIRAIRLDPPDEAGLVARSWDEADIMALERVQLPAGFDGVHHRRIVRYQKNWTVQQDSELAATAASRAYRQREWKTVIGTATNVARNSIDPIVLDTSLTAKADADDLAGHLLDMHGVPRRMFSLETRIFGESIPALGGQVRITYPRFGLNQGRVFRVIALDLGLAGSAASYLVWG